MLPAVRRPLVAQSFTTCAYTHAAWYSLFSRLLFAMARRRRAFRVHRYSLSLSVAFCDHSDYREVLMTLGVFHNFLFATQSVAKSSRAIVEASPTCASVIRCMRVRSLDFKFITEVTDNRRGTWRPSTTLDQKNSHR